MNYNISRSNWKAILIKRSILLKNIKNSKIPIKIFSRSSFITPCCLGLNFLVHNGKKFTPLTVTESMIGHKFGEFSLTRKKNIYKK